MEEQSFLVTLTKEVPKEFLVYWAEYLGEWKGLQHFLAAEVVPSFPLVEMMAIPNNPKSKECKGYIPTSFVLSITSSPEGRHPVGFLPRSQ